MLPFDGEVNYFGKIMPNDEANRYLNSLLNTIQWKNDEVVIFGKHYITKRKVAWYGDSDYKYTYSNTTKKALAWTKELQTLKQIAQDFSRIKFNSCLLNLYPTGEVGMGWHSDDEKSLGKETTIVSITFGAERKMSFKHKSRHKKSPEKSSIFLENGSLLIMKGSTQTHWLHSLPKTAKVNSPRINLTFRTFVD